MLRKLATLVFLCASVLCAQQERQPQQQTEQKTQEESVDVTIKIFKWAYSNAMTIPNIGGGVSTVRASKDQNFDLWYKSGDAYKVLKVSSGSMSNAIHYKGPRTMVFYKREAVATEDGHAVQLPRSLPHDNPSRNRRAFRDVVQNGTLGWYSTQSTSRRKPSQKRKSP